MTIKRITAVILASVLIFLFSGCSQPKNKMNDEWEQFGSSATRKIGLVITAGEKGGAGTGAIEPLLTAVKKAATDQGVEYKILNPGDLANDKESLVYLAENQFNLVIAYGKGIEKPLSQIAADYPDVRFAIVGGEVDKPNVTSIKIEHSEGAFLAGVAAGSLTKSNIVGFLGGSEATDGAAATGFARGVYFANLVEGKKAKVNTIYAGVTGEAAQDPVRGYNLANTLYWSGADVVFCTSGKMDSGAVKSAEENRKIIVVSNVPLIAQHPWNVYASLTDKSENAVYDVIKEALAGKLEIGRTGYGVAEGAVDIVTSEAVPQEVKYRLQDVKNKLKNGQIKPYALAIPAGLVNEINQVPVDWGKQPSGQSNSGQSNNSQRNAGRTNTGQSNAGQSNAGQSNAGQSNAGQSNAGQSNAGQSNTGQSNAGQSNSGQSNAGQSNAGQSNTGQNNAGQSNTDQGDVGQTGASQTNAGQNNTNP